MKDSYNTLHFRNKISNSLFTSIVLHTNEYALMYDSLPMAAVGKEGNMKTKLSRDMTKPTKWLCTQRRLISAWAFTQSDQSLRCPHEESLGP